MPVSEWTNCIINLNSMSGLWGVLVATIFVIRFFPQKIVGKLFGKLVGKFVGKFEWKIGWKCWVDNWLEMLVGNVGWKMLVEHLAGKNVG